MSQTFQWIDLMENLQNTMDIYGFWLTYRAPRKFRLVRPSAPGASAASPTSAAASGPF
jgi:hypothetical protein